MSAMRRTLPCCLPPLAGLLITLLLFIPSAAAGEGRGSLAVLVKGLRSEKGSVGVALYRTGDGFPMKPQKALRTLRAPARGGTASVLFEDLPLGTYAVSAFHDEDADGKLTTNWLGIPKEGVGASNDPKSRFGPPGFEDARFELSAPRLEIALTVRYL
jgi:uncharacterized protein (DUF2141 family)